MNKVLNLTELGKCFKKLEEHLDSGHLGLGTLKKLNFLDDDFKSIFFPLHDRRELEGRDYSKLFANIKSVKGFLDKFLVERKKATLQLISKGDQPQVPKPKPPSQTQQQDFNDARSLASKLHNPSLNFNPFGSLAGSIGRGRIGEVDIQSIDGFALKPALINPLYEERARKVRASLVSIGFIEKGNGFTNKLLDSARKLAKSELTEDNPEFAKADETTRKYARIFQKLKPKYVVDDTKLVEAIMNASETSQSIRNFVPQAFLHRKIEDFRYSSDFALSYPVSKAIVPKKLINYFFGHLRSYPMDTMRQYFGEKIALYFSFVAFYRDRLVVPSIVGVLMAIFLFVYRGGEQLKEESDPAKVKQLFGSWRWTVERGYEWCSTFFAIYVTIWSTYFLKKWDSFEKEFAVKYGQTELEDTKTIRPSFRGVCKRGLNDDKMNNFFENQKVTSWKFCAMLVFIAVWLAATVGVSYLVLYLKRKAYREDWMGESETAAISMNQAVFDLIEFLRIMLFQWVFFRVITKLVRWQNLKYVEDHESQLVVILGLYQLVNNSCIIVIVMFQSLLNRVATSAGDLDPTTATTKAPELCLDDDCTEELTYFFATYVVFQAIWTLAFKLIILPIYEKVESATKKLIPRKKADLKEASRVSPEDVESQKRILEEIGNLFNRQIITVYEKQRIKSERMLRLHFLNPAYFYDEINREIEQQVTKLKDYKIGEDFDQSLVDYLELFNMFSYVTMFGVLFPLSFFGVSAMVFAEWKMDNQMLVGVARRPKPFGANSIGLWKDMIQLVSLLSVCTNAYFIAFILFEKNNLRWKFILYISITVGVTIATWLMYQLSAGTTDKVAKVVDRTGYIKSLIFSSSMKTKAVPETYSRPLQVQSSFVIEGLEKESTSRQGVNIFDIGRDDVEDKAERKAIEKDLRLMEGFARKNLAVTGDLRSRKGAPSYKPESVFFNMQHDIIKEPHLEV